MKERQRKALFLTKALILTLFLAGCSFSSSDSVRVRFKVGDAFRFATPYLPPFTLSGFADGGPPTAGHFPCFALNVVGAGIPSHDPNETDLRLDSILNGNHCTYPGIGSTLVSGGAEREISLVVRRGEDRVIQVLGVQSSIGCPAVDVAQLIYRSRAAATLPAGFNGFYELGRVRRHLFDDVNLEIENEYPQTTLKNVRLCSNGTALNEIAFSPNPRALHTGERMIFSASGGNGVSSFATPVGTGTLNGALQYTAASSSETAVIRALDPLANFTDLQIQVYDPATAGSSASRLKIWLSPDSYHGQTNGSGVTTDWTNRAYSGAGSGAGIDAITHTSSTGQTYLYSATPTGTPAVAFTSSANSHRSGLSLGNDITGLTIFLVARKVSGTSGLLCLSDGSSSHCNSPANTDFFQIGSVSGLFFNVNDVGGTGASTTPMTVPSSEWMLIMADWTGTTATIRALTPTASYGPASANATITPDITSGYIFLDSNDGSSSTTSEIAELLVYDEVLPATGFNSVAQYLILKYGIDGQ